MPLLRSPLLYCFPSCDEKFQCLRTDLSYFPNLLLVLYTLELKCQYTDIHTNMFYSLHEGLVVCITADRGEERVGNDVQGQHRQEHCL